MSCRKWLAAALLAFIALASGGRAWASAGDPGISAPCANVPNVTPNSATAVNFLVINSGSGKSFCDASATVGATSTYFLLFDATTQQSGSVTYKAFGGTLIDCIGPVANGALSFNYAANPISGFSTGIMVETSTTGCLTVTPATNLIIRGRAQ